ncbi:enoyl-CoA hydratase [Magnetospira thiophila]
MTDPLVLCTDDAGVRTLTLNRPNSFNALSVEMIAALRGVIAETATDNKVRVVVIAAAGRAFCAGHDLKELRAFEDRDDHLHLFRQCGQLMLDLTHLPQPVIARVHGLTTAAGCQLVAQCDLAVASHEARFATSGIGIGLFCSTPGVAVARNLPRKMALEMLLTGDFIDADAALDLGLLNRVVPIAELDDAIAELTGKILNKPALSIALGKRAFYRQVESKLDEAYELAADTMADNMMTEDARAGIEAFLSKSPMPEWKGR